MAAPFASSLLADFGADVVKVEPAGGDPYRVYSASYTAVNQRKRAAALDLRKPDERGALLRLAADADVLVDNLRADSMTRLGLGDGVLAAAFPRLVRCSVSAYGRTGAFADLPGFDPVMQARSGMMLAQGGADDPVASVAPIHDVGTAALAALGILAALFARGPDWTRPARHRVAGRDVRVPAVRGADDVRRAAGGTGRRGRLPRSKRRQALLPGVRRVAGRGRHHCGPGRGASVGRGPPRVGRAGRRRAGRPAERRAGVASGRGLGHGASRRARSRPAGCCRAPGSLPTRSWWRTSSRTSWPIPWRESCG